YFAYLPMYYYKPGDYHFIDLNADGIMDGDLAYMGSALPVLTGGLGSEFRYKNFDLNVLFSYQIGRHMINTTPSTSLRTNYGNYLIHPLLLDLNRITFWEKPGDEADYMPIQLDISYQTSGLSSPSIDRY